MSQTNRQLMRRRRRRRLMIRRTAVLAALAAVLILAVFGAVRCAGRIRSGREQKAAQEKAQEPRQFSVTLRFAGDINFADDYFPMQHYQESGAGSIEDVIDPEYVKLMRDADLMWINNEFCYSDRGEPYPGKEYTFRADPKHAQLLKEMGVDVAGLANNHVFDYQEDALLDTFDTLKDAGIPYVGAGHDIDEAAAPVYAEAGPLKVAFVAAERAEKSLLATREATEDQAGVLRCYDNERFLASIQEAAEHADYVVALPHWGTEHSTVLEDAQTEGARACLDAGADAVVGGHPHVLQGMDFYEDKPIVYSLGNFWFDNYDLMTMIAELHISGTVRQKEVSGKEETHGREISDLKTELIIYPGRQSGTETHPAADEAGRDEIFRHLEEISSGIQIDEKGVVSPH